MSRMEVAIPSSPSMDFDFFNEAHPVSYLSAPSTPKRFGDYSFLSAPTSPSRVAEFYSYFDHLSGEEFEERVSFSTRVPFDWEEKPGTPKSPKAGAVNFDFKEDEFAFDFTVELEKASLSTAEELFDGGKIKPLKPPPGLKLQVQSDSIRSPLLSPRTSSPRSPIAQGKRIIKEAFSPRRKKDSDPFGAARKGVGNERGRERGLTPSSSRRAGTRSLSPYRVSGYAWEDKEEEEQMAKQQTAKQPCLDSKGSVSSTSSSSSSKSSSRKWRLKDLLLFRSASEGRASEKDPLGKYSTAALFRNRKHHHQDQDVKNSSFRSTEGHPGSVSKNRRRKAPVSAHELHYTLNKAASEDLKKKTFLPYKQGILGRLAFNPAIHALSNGFGSLSR